MENAVEAKEAKKAPKASTANGTDAAAPPTKGKKKKVRGCLQS